MGQAGNLGVELQPRFALGLRQLELALFVLADVLYADRLAEICEDLILGRVDYRRELVHLFLHGVICALRLKKASSVRQNLETN